MQATAALEVVINNEEEKEKNNSQFVKQETFAPAQKNERQLRFKQTSGSAGRKKKLKLR